MTSHYDFCKKNHAPLIQSSNSKYFLCTKCKVFYVTPDPNCLPSFLKPTHYDKFPNIKIEALDEKIKKILVFFKEKIDKMHSGQVEEVFIKPQEIGIIDFIIEYKNHTLLKDATFSTFSMRYTITKH